ncbi:MAG: DUF4276 family protein [Methanocorpusculum sp.]|nr:DUF4276 family protein [Methanocorpusculum sp.]
MLLKILAEGQTESKFIMNILEPYLSEIGYMVSPIIIGTSRRQRGGLSHYNQFKTNIFNLCGSSDCLITTMIDFYQLPSDFPGFKDAQSVLNHADKVKLIEERLNEEINIRPPNYFIPYIQLHEFEALLFSDIDIIDDVLKFDCCSDIRKLKSIMDKYHEPENINTDEGPSVKLKKLTHDNYQKTLHGIRIAERIQLDVMRDNCHHFNNWLEKMEKFADRYC